MGGTFSDQNAEQLPELGSYITRIVQLNISNPPEVVPIIQPFAKAPNAIIAIEENGILVFVTTRKM